ncbi:MAG: BadF/BadG/BcrA/BcrD ATPase family protein [Bacteroidota bacterium]
MNNNYTVIGIDGGGSKTRGRLVYGEQQVQRVIGSTRVGVVGFTEACERVVQLLVDLTNDAGIDKSEIDAVVIGVAGIWLEEERQRFAHLLRIIARDSGFNLHDLIATSDAEIALRGAFGKDAGIMLIAGTGTITLGKNKQGDLIRSGGWGIEIDDEGSGAWIGKKGLSACVKAIDGRGIQTSLLHKLADRYPQISLKFPRTIVSAFMDKVFEYHHLTQMVLEEAENGDSVCLEIVKEAAERLHENIMAVAKNMPGIPLPVSFLGGLLENNTLIARELLNKIKEKDSFNVVEPKGTALDGAIEYCLELVAKSKDI